MKIRLLVIGKTEEEYLRQGISEYAGRVKRYVPFEILEIPSPRNISSLSLAEQKSKEAELIEKQIRTGDLVVLLDEHGQELTSTAFSKFLNQRFLSGARNMSFIIGGPFGFDESLHKRADFILSLSKMTFSHQMIRLFFTEQLYRALTILRGESYHHD
jgi:23S rRNA (pseudouridine1915-N3)-methyltransferase